MDKNTDFLDLVIERNTLLHQLNESRKKEEYTDVKLQIGDKLFPAHRAVLSHSSPFLKPLISEQWSTTNVCLLSEEYVDVEIMEDLLSFFYTGSIKLTPDNVYSVCMAAHFLQISTLLEPSVKYLCQYITLDNVFTFSKFATVFEIEKLNYYCLKFVHKNHESVFQNSQILELSFEDFKDLIVGLKNFWNKVLRENTFQCIVRWTEKNLSERSDQLPVLLKNIPLEELPLKFLTEIVSTHPLVKESISGIETVSDALANYQTYSTDSNHPWKTNQNIIVLGETENDRVVRLYDPRSGVWSDLPDLPAGRIFFGVAVVNHQDIVLCGGVHITGRFTSTSDTLSSVIMFDWSTQTWKELPEMPLTCSSTSVANCNDHIYLFGDFSNGEEESTHSKKVLRYSFETEQWEFVASTNEEHASGFLVEHKNHLYAFGGPSKSIEKYDPARDKWTIMTRFPGRDIFGVTVHQGKIYILHFKGIEVYHPETNSFETFPEPPVALTLLVSLNGKLLVFSSHETPEETSRLIYEFDFPKGKWVKFGKFDFPCYEYNVVGAFH